ncbi:hypothetical protein QFC20_005233 [Naganishia adeliensis]|uniref:Uncharacterized protein n=1 Tax=Naganishia adeliensis TaxID=92952 RepID=A0ACC2VR23_9TREE|nr:hypothetical protein QFC20_005233 [Naganishia adeliensis]
MYAHLPHPFLSISIAAQFPAFQNGFKNAFQVPGRANMKDLGEAITEGVSTFPDPGVLGTFISSHDASRFRAITSSDSVAYNALVWQFMFDGIPITYYGEEQEISSGLADPDQRQALWGSGDGGYSGTTNTYRRLQMVNNLRKFLMSTDVTLATGQPGFGSERAKVVLSSATDLVFIKGPIFTVLNNVGR